MAFVTADQVGSFALIRCLPKSSAGLQPLSPSRPRSSLGLVWSMPKEGAKRPDPKGPVSITENQKWGATAATLSSAPGGTVTPSDFISMMNRFPTLAKE